MNIIKKGTAARRLLSKLTIVFLMVSFFIPSTQVVLAKGNTDNTTIAAPATTQKDTTLPPPSDTSTTTSTTSLITSKTPDASAPVTPPISPDSSKPTDTNAPAQDATPPVAHPASTPSSSSPLGSISSASSKDTKVILPQTDANTGALVYDYPITVPAGRNGLAPDLSIHYNSQKNDNNSITGYGWEFSIPYIVRKNTHGTDQLYTRNDYTSFEDGDLALINTSGSILTFVPESQTSSFNQYTLNTNNDTWKMTTKSGTVFTFGDTQTTRQGGSSAVSDTYKWMLSSITDTNANTIVYTYSKDAGQIYLANIHYAIFDVDITKEARPDIMSDYRSGFLITTNFRISQMQIRSSGTLRNSYALSYTTGDNGKRSLLQSVLQTAYDINGAATVLPATVFGYTAHQGPIFDVNVSAPENGLSLIGNSSKGIITGDINSDGYPDIVKAYEWVYGNYTSDKKIYLFDPKTNSFYLSASYPVPAGIMNFTDSPYNTYEGGTRIVDVNGDGKNDLIRTPYAYGPAADKEINTGNGWTQIPNTDPTYSVQYVSNPAYTLFTDDLNGDGLVDYLQDSGAYLKLPENQIWYLTETSLNNGSGFTYAVTGENHGGTGTQPYAYTPVFTGNGEFLMFDINGDNLPDIIQSTYTQASNSYVKKVYINNGSSWQLDNSYVLPPNFSYLTNGAFGSAFTPIQIADFNNDGLNDVLVFGSTIYINQGKSFTESSLSYDMSLTMANANVSRSYLFMDANADGTPDFIILGSPRAYYNTVTTHVDLLKSITIPSGAISTITYKPSTQYKDGAANPLNASVPFTVQTVNIISTTDTANNITNTDTYAYTDGYYYTNAANVSLRKFAGFGTITKTDSNGNVTKTYFHQGNTSNSGQGEYQDDYWKIGKPYRTEQYDNANRLFAKTITAWQDVDLGSGAKFVAPARVVQYSYDGDSVHQDTAESDTYNNATGNLTQKIQYGLVLGNDDGTFNDNGFDLFTTNYTYAAGGAIIGLPSQITVTDQGATKVKESRFYYDALALGSVVKGSLTKQEDWKTGSTYINNQKTYNSLGLVTTSTDPRSNVTQYQYDANSLYPIIVINPKNQTTQYTYDYALGQVIQTIDPNGRLFQSGYDGLGRLIFQKQPDIVSPSSLVYKTTSVYTDTPGAISVKTSNYLDDAIAVNSITYFDSLNRKIQARTQAEGGNFSVKDYAYNNLGQLLKESLPYFSGGINKTFLTLNGTLYTTYIYDSLGRATLAVNALGVTQTTYNDWKVTTQDANGKYKDAYQDAYGNIIQIDEHNAGNTYSTFYVYNYLGNVTKITDAAQDIRNFTYDGLQKRIMAEDLHAPADTWFGIWIFAYDDAGNLTKTVDPKNQTVNYTYDSLNRPLTEDFTGSAGTEVAYIYDGGVDGIGRLTSVTTSTSTKSYSYNALGLVQQENDTIGAVHYITSYDYNHQQQPITITNPDNSQIKYGYNSAGLLEKIQRKESTDSAFADTVSNFDYSPTGQITLQQDANGASTANTYNSARLYQLINKTTTIAGGAIGQNLTYTYDNVGNILTVVDASATGTSKNVQYIYDDLYRLTSATASNVDALQNPYTQTYTYDAIGNILTKTETIGANPTVTYTYSYTSNTGTSSANPHAVTSIANGSSTTVYAYDNNGNMTAEGSSAYTFDYHNRLIQSTVASTSSAPPPTETTVTFYPVAGSGFVAYNATGTWNAIHNATSGNNPNYTSTTINTKTGNPSAGNFVIGRGFLPFNTSSLPDNATITDVKLKVYVSNVIDNDNDGNDFISLVHTTQPSTNLLTNDDYDLVGAITNPPECVDSTERKDLTSIPVGQYLTFTLNATGRSFVNKTANTKLGLREGHDIINSPFVGAVGKFNLLEIHSSEYAGTSSDPILQVTYTLPSNNVPPPPVITNYAYDASGQRIKVAGPTLTTIYPTPNYNIDNATPTPKITKHIFTGAQNIATIEGSGAAAKIYYNHSDLLNSSSILTDSAGALAETLDYFPFGTIRLDTKADTLNEQRKYIGQEYDASTGLNYFNARYYDASIGRFISQDPMFWGQQNLSDPQSLNSYSYAENNPIVNSDPTGLFVAEVAGTKFWGGGTEFSGKGGEILQSNVEKSFPGQKTGNYTWDGADNKNARSSGTEAFGNWLDGQMKSLSTNEPLNIVCHSHGCNMVAQYTNSDGAKKIDNLISLGQPVRGEYPDNEKNISNHINVYSSKDMVQRLGGGQLKLSEAVGGLFGGLGSLIGQGLGWGEFGRAGRTVSGTNNLDVTDISRGNIFSSHLDLYQNQAIWDRLSKSIK